MLIAMRNISGVPILFLINRRDSGISCPAVGIEQVMLDPKVAISNKLLQGIKMKLTKRQLRRIIKEEKSNILKEYHMPSYSGSSLEESISPLIAFANAWSGLGGAVQEQITDLMNIWLDPDADLQLTWEDAIWNQNPGAIRMAYEKLSSPIRNLDGQDAKDLSEMLASGMEELKKADGPGPDA